MRFFVVLVLVVGVGLMAEAAAIPNPEVSELEGAEVQVEGVKDRPKRFAVGSPEYNALTAVIACATAKLNGDDNGSEAVVAREGEEGGGDKFSSQRGVSNHEIEDVLRNPALENFLEVEPINSPTQNIIARAYGGGGDTFTSQKGVGNIATDDVLRDAKIQQLLQLLAIGSPTYNDIGSRSYGEEGGGDNFSFQEGFLNLKTKDVLRNPQLQNVANVLPIYSSTGNYLGRASIDEEVTLTGKEDHHHVGEVVSHPRGRSYGGDAQGYANTSPYQAYSYTAPTASYPSAAGGNYQNYPLTNLPGYAAYPSSGYYGTYAPSTSATGYSSYPAATIGQQIYG